MGLDVMRKKIVLSVALVFVLFVFGACGGGGGLDGGIGEIEGDGGTNSMMVGWVAPTTNEDGTRLEDLAGYRLYYGYRSGDYSFVANINRAYTQVSIGGLSTTTWYLAVTAYDYFGNESEFSNEISYTF